MNTANPTPVRIGMTGQFANARYRVAGRVLMSMDDAGSTYYWNEFYLVAEDGNCATLVHEPTEQGEAWRLFTLIEPLHPITAADAATKRIGETIDLNGAPLRITTVDESKVCFIEGEAPEGVELGDIARYFNAESGNEMIVVSWTGDEVEFYRGITFPSHVVENAFDLPTKNRKFALSPAPSAAPTPAAVPIVGIIITVVIIILFSMFGFKMCVSNRHSNRQRSVPAEVVPQPRKISVGDTGTLEGRDYQVVGYDSVEVGEVGRRVRRFEYHLMDSRENDALLIHGTTTSASDCLLCVPISTPPALTGSKAAALRVGDSLALDAETARVEQLFRTTIISAFKGSSLQATPDNFLYGLAARAGNQRYVIRWNETNITCYVANPISEKTALGAFKK